MIIKKIAFIAAVVTYGIITTHISCETACPSKTIIVGSSTPVGFSFAKLLAAQGSLVGLADHDTDFLMKLQQTIDTPTYSAFMDIDQSESAVEMLNALIHEMNGCDLFIFAVNSEKTEVACELTDIQGGCAMINRLIVGFFRIASTMLHFFEDQGRGHFVVASYRNDHSPLSAAIHAFCSCYLTLIKRKYHETQIPITITEIDLPPI